MSEWGGVEWGADGAHARARSLHCAPTPLMAIRRLAGSLTPAPTCRECTLQAALELTGPSASTDLLSALGLTQVSQGDLQASRPRCPPPAKGNTSCVGCAARRAALCSSRPAVLPAAGGADDATAGSWEPAAARQALSCDEELLSGRRPGCRRASPPTNELFSWSRAARIYGSSWAWRSRSCALWSGQKRWVLQAWAPACRLRACR